MADYSSDDPQLRHAKVLGLVDHRMGERLIVPSGELRRDFREDGRPGEKALRLYDLACPHKDGPEFFASLGPKRF